ncbi:potassium transport protein 1 [Macrophomina phaseolina]|uniref:Potassium transport protein 1 n=1 Tax=Macrophomina phaseolina TaxID=35725 RepID=A0ABQ8GVX2_9PEZI|nr:potassium transport protein 1 [Macrophomina phaseolina]
MRDPIEEVRNPGEAKEHFLQYLKNEVFHLNFYRMHMLYFIAVILVGSVIVYGAGLADDSNQINGDSLRYIDALFLCCSAMTTTGLNSVNLGSLTGFQQAVLCILLIIGTVPFVSSFVVVIRRHYFHRKLADVVQHSRSGRQMVRDLEEQDARKHRGIEEARQDRSTSRIRRRNVPTNHRDTSERRPLRDHSRQQRQYQSRNQEKPPNRRLYHHTSGFGAFPWPWEAHNVQRLFHYPFQRLHQEWQPHDWSYISFTATYDARGRFRNLSEHERAELGGVEYRALELLLTLLIAYQLFWYAVGTAFLVPYAYRDAIATILKTSQPGDLSPGWWGFFATVTSFSNGGLNVLNSNYIPFSGNALILVISGALTVAGNTQFPILLRLLIWTLSKSVPTASRLRQTCLFLLHHPRRCFIYLFPAKETWYLLAIQLSIDLAMWILYEILNIGLPPVEAAGPLGTRILDGLFQATGLRNSGAYIIAISSLAPALLVAYLVTMYISSFPIVMALRQTNTYEERSVGLDRRHPESGGGSEGRLGMHLRRQLAYDIWFQLLAWFLICVIERAKLIGSEPSFTIFSVLFEVTSAYGTVGLSTGVPYDQYSLSGAFRAGSKVVMLGVMLRGRHRGLPLAIDRSILLPGEELMHRMDREYGEYGQWSCECEAECRRDEEQSGLGSLGPGKGLSEQDPERLREDDAGSARERGMSSSRTEDEDYEPHFEMT